MTAISPEQPGAPSLQARLLPVNPDLVLPFLRESYGPNYKGDDSIRAHFERIDRVVGLTDELSELAAAAMIETISSDRIITVATSPDVSRFGRRKELMVMLLRSCRESGQARWISIGEQYGAMQSAAQKADMARVPEIGIVKGMLEGAGLDSHYELGEDTQGIAVITTRSGPNTGSVQQVWAWEEAV